MELTKFSALLSLGCQVELGRRLGERIVLLPLLHVFVDRSLRTGGRATAFAGLRSLSLLANGHLIHRLEGTVHARVVQIALLVAWLPLMALSSAFHRNRLVSISMSVLFPKKI